MIFFLNGKSKRDIITVPSVDGRAQYSMSFPAPSSMKTNWSIVSPMPIPSTQSLALLFGIARAISDRIIPNQKWWIVMLEIWMSISGMRKIEILVIIIVAIIIA